MLATSKLTAALLAALQLAPALGVVVSVCLRSSRGRVPR
jgi:hypothetical protein